jgi:phosphoribosylanthranilate isomerase
LVKVKVCGITNLKDAEAACRFGADALGFVFAESPRRIDVSKARAISLKMPPYVTLVGVFVDEDINKLLKIAEKCRIDLIQLHGDESINYCKQLKKYYKIVKAVKVGGKNSFNSLSGYDVDAFLLDTYRPGKAGGTGEKFDWSLALQAKKHGKPIMLSGGLRPGNVSEAIRKVKPYAVDVSSGIESSPGRKNMKLMKEFIHKAKKTS